MKNKFNYLLKALFIFISLLFLGCETQEEVVSSSENFKKYEISFKEFNNDQQARVSFKKLKEKQKINKEAKKGNEQQRILYNKEYDFFIDTDKIVVVEIDDFKSYTFQIHRPEENAKLENLVLNSKNNADFKTYITKYNVTELEKQILSNNGYVDVTNDVDIEILDESKFAQFSDGPCTLVVSSPYSQNHLGQETAGYFEKVLVPCGTEGADCPPGACDGGSIGDDSNTNQGNTGTGYSPSGYTPNFNGGNGGVGSFPTGNNPNGSNQPGGGTNSSNVFVSAPTVSLEDSEVKEFIKSLSDDQRDFLFPDIDLNNLEESSDDETWTNIVEYLNENDFSDESEDFIKDFIDSSISNPSLELDINSSSTSPFFVDLSSVKGNTPEEIKFREVYKTLSQSTGFKNLFNDLFNTTPLFNVKFIIEELEPLPPTYSIPDGLCTAYKYPNDLAPFNIIRIDKSTLLDKSKIDIAIILLHECIHAYLNIKLLNPSIGMSLTSVNSMNIQECINTYYNGFSVTESQHSFFVDFMVPTMTQILMDVKDTLATPSQINELENPTNGSAILYAPMGSPPTISDVQIPWDWETCFNHLSYMGLQNCTSYPFNYPVQNTQDYYHLRYIIAFNAIFNP